MHPPPLCLGGLSSPGGGGAVCKEAGQRSAAQAVPLALCFFVLVTASSSGLSGASDLVKRAILAGACPPWVYLLQEKPLPAAPCWRSLARTWSVALGGSRDCRFRCPSCRGSIYSRNE